MLGEAEIECLSDVVDGQGRCPPKDPPKSFFFFFNFYLVCFDLVGES